MAKSGKGSKGGKGSRLRFWRRESIGPAAAQGPRRRMVRIALGAGLLGAGLAAGLWAMERLAVRAQRHGAPPIVGLRIVERPAWMPDRLARRIAAEILPRDADFYDRTLTKDVYRLAAAHPWIRRVESVSKHRSADGAEAYIELRAEFRQAIARAGNLGRFYYIDAEGVVLPDSPADPQVPKIVVEERPGQGRTGSATYYAHRNGAPAASAIREIHYIIIDGVESPAPAPGHKWPGDDLADGLRLVKLLLGRDYADQITVVDVHNHAGRISDNAPEITVHAQVGRGRATEIRFGQFPRGADYVVRPEIKLANLDQYVADHGGRLAGVNEYVDLRYDELHTSIN